jgi:hypothetical protein
MTSPFNWKAGESSIFAADKAFTGYSTGKTPSQVSADASDAYTQKTGRSLGTVTGISTKSDRDAEVRAYMRRKG